MCEKNEYNIYDHINFFKKLLSKTEDAYRESDVYNKYKDKNWGYSVTATRFEKNIPLIVGFNWGAGKEWDEKRPIQKDYPHPLFGQIENEKLGSFKRIINFFDKYIPMANYGIQSNFCFFRSQHEYQISNKDKQSCIPLFVELVEYLEPSIIINFSRFLDEYFPQTNIIIDKQTSQIKSNNRHVYASKGSVVINNNKIDYFNLPHPNSRITSEARLKAWDFCFRKTK